MREVKYRLNEPRLAPRRTKLEIPGWAGEREQRVDGSHEYVWHCLPFSEGAQYGIELFYPYDNELHVSTREGRLHLEGDFGPPPDEDLQWPPFKNFGDKFYTYQILLDLRPGPGFAIRTEPHPRFYTDRTDTVPIAVPALVRNWWPMMFFTVFKAPAEGGTPHFQAGRALRADYHHSGGGRHHPVADGRTGMRRARAASPADTREPRYVRHRDEVGFAFEDCLRRHLPSHPARVEGESLGRERRRGRLVGARVARRQ